MCLQYLNKWFKRLDNLRYRTRLFLKTRTLKNISARSDIVYREYLQKQLEGSFGKEKSRPGVKLLPRTRYLAKHLRNYLPNDQNLTILCVGCRSAAEIDHVQEVCDAEVHGVDLFSSDPRIRVADMHKLPYGREQYSAVFSCHSLEHSINHRKALAEMLRVLKFHGILTIEVPINYIKESGPKHCRSHQVDFGSLGGLIAEIEAIDGYRISVLWMEESVRELESGGQSEEIRIIVKKLFAI